MRNLKESQKNGHVVRKIQINGSDGTREISQYHYLAWPDHGVPSETQTLNFLLTDLKVEEAKENGPIAVHCSAGVGRTGTLIALSILHGIIAEQKKRGVDIGISIFSVVRRLREQRIMMVQSEEQYQLLYNFVAEWTS